MLSLYFQQCDDGCNIFQFLLALFKQNPYYLIYFIVGVFVVGTFLVFIAGIIQGRGISIWGLKIDPKIHPTTKSEIDIDGIEERIIEKLSKENLQSNVLRYSPPELTKQQIFIYSARQDIREKITDIVLSYGGGWAGVSMAGFDTFFSLARDHKLISDRLAEDINEFIYYTREILNDKHISADGIKYAQEFYELIRVQIDATPRKSLQNG